MYIAAAVGGNPSSPGKSSALGNLRSALRNQNSGKTGNLGIISLTNFLKTALNITHEPELRRIVDIMTNKNSLYASKGGSGRQAGNPYARLVSVDEAQVVVDCMKEFGFTIDEIRQLVIAFPQLLCYSVERVDDLLDFFVSTAGISGGEVRRMLLARPTILGLPRRQLEQIVGFLLENGSSQEDVVYMLQKSL